MGFGTVALFHVARAALFEQRRLTLPTLPFCKEEGQHSPPPEPLNVPDKQPGAFLALPGASTARET